MQDTSNSNTKLKFTKTEKHLAKTINPEKAIFGLIKDNVKITTMVVEENIENTIETSNEELKLNKKRKREGNYNTGRWQQDEHRRFIEALIKYGNDWKNVQKHVCTRSSTQARSHAQKFFVKLSKTHLENVEQNLTSSNFKELLTLKGELDDNQIMKAVEFFTKNALNISNKENSNSSWHDFNDSESNNSSKELNTEQTLEIITKK